jgi:hypothetical protein
MPSSQRLRISLRSNSAMPPMMVMTSMPTSLVASHQLSPRDTKPQLNYGLLIYCADYRCSHSIAISGDQWPDDLRPSDIEPRFVCRACGKRGADVRPDFNWNGAAVGRMGYRWDSQSAA